MLARVEWDGSRTIFLPSFRLAAAPAPLFPAHFRKAPEDELVNLESVDRAKADVEEPIDNAAMEEIVEEDDGAEESDPESEVEFDAEFEPAQLEVADNQLFILREKEDQ
ncbi:unnamed protein product [Oikopleura dioica]|uniref:Uncharacterized protein n=1 Tax=Oikopleura dioica TaxID=34765 RepID=E4XRV3_OIKDI|nr:unnamed protein product [Oikopleura dioica]